MIIETIKSLNQLKSLTKKERIINAIQDCINNNYLKHGDSLPSVNELSRQLGYSRETVVKAYKALKNRGIINSKHGLGYFVNSTDIGQKLSIALIMYGFQSFQQVFYNTLRKGLGKDYNIDVFFHHNNMGMYHSILNATKGQYGLYIIAPIQTREAEELLREFPKEKILIVDRYQYLGDQVSHITQEFEISLTAVFESLKERFKNFNKTILFFRDDMDYPEGIKISFEAFCKTNELKYQLEEEYSSELLEPGVLYFTVGDADLWTILKEASNKGYKIGDEIGILSHNDTPVKEIICGGITTFSTDFELMAKRAVGFVKSRKLSREIIPSVLIRRNSL